MGKTIRKLEARGLHTSSLETFLLPVLFSGASFDRDGQSKYKDGKNQLRHDRKLKNKCKSRFPLIYTRLDNNGWAESVRSTCFYFLLFVLALLLLDLFSAQLFGYSSRLRTYWFKSSRSLRSQALDFDPSALMTNKHGEFLYDEPLKIDEEPEIDYENLEMADSDPSPKGSGLQISEKDKIKIACARSSCESSCSEIEYEKCIKNGRTCSAKVKKSCRKSCLKEECVKFCNLVPKIGYVEREQQRENCKNNCDEVKSDEKSSCIDACEKVYKPCKSKCMAVVTDLGCTTPSYQILQELQQQVINKDGF